MSIDDPQVEFGYVKIATELLWAMDRARLSPQKRAILGCILINTYGRGKKEAHISIDYFMSYTGMTRKNVHKTIGYMKKENLINAFQIEGKRNLKYSINKKYRSWGTTSKQKLPTSIWKPKNLRLEVPLPYINKENNINSRRRPAAPESNNHLEDATKIFELYSTLVASTHRTPKAAKTNIAHWLKTYTRFQLEGAVKNYAAQCEKKGTKNEYRKDARNFFGKVKPHIFLDYLPTNYVAPVRDRSKEGF